MFQTCRLSKSAPALIYRWAAAAGGLEGGCQAVVLGVAVTAPRHTPRADTERKHGEAGWHEEQD